MGEAGHLLEVAFRSHLIEGGHEGLRPGRADPLASKGAVSDELYPPHAQVIPITHRYSPTSNRYVTSTPPKEGSMFL